LPSREKFRGDDAAHPNEQLRARAASLLLETGGIKRPSCEPAIRFDLIVTHNEVNRRHGTGVILENIFSEDSALISFRARDDYQGEQTFGALNFRLPREGLSRTEIFQTLVKELAGLSVRRILCVPFYPESAMIAIAAREIFGVPLCTYIMDDANIHAQGIPDELMTELLDKSELRLAISPEMRQVYEAKYRRKFWLLPPIVSASGITTRSNPPANRGARAGRGVLVGNIWDQHWLGRLMQAVKDSNLKIDWYYNGGAVSWVHFTEAEIGAAGITLCQPLSERMMAAALRGYSFALVPSGTLDPNDGNPAIARLSLPSRIPFIVATSNLPIVVMGHPDTAAARFVRRFQLGACCDYGGFSLMQAVRKVTDPDNASAIRQRAMELAPNFSSEGIAEWIWSSLANGEPRDARFETLMSPQEREFAYYVKRDLPKDVRAHHDFLEIYGALERLKELGFNPDFVIDVGASDGIWSHIICRLFGNARFILAEPLASRYRERNDYLFTNHPEFEVVETALSDRAGSMTIHLSPNLYGSSFFLTKGIAVHGQAVVVEVKTLDQVAAEKQILGRGLVKLDVQFAEHLVLAGGSRFIEQVDAIAIELSLSSLPEGAKSFLEMLNLMDGLGFEYFDDVGEWRSPKGVLKQKDVLFVRKGLIPIDPQDLLDGDGG